MEGEIKGLEGAKKLLAQENKELQAEINRLNAELITVKEDRDEKQKQKDILFEKLMAKQREVDTAMKKLKDQTEWTNNQYKTPDIPWLSKPIDKLLDWFK
ncbi:hypothetical protein J8J04_00265 ['Fragaria x ananassa' phyllody phytoplasma]|uniref:Uncharacterized protein n=1 Tax='Fragaria x ananassa' phyllody phytoplasma TaxID=2358428 RepID=A0ABS5K2Q3_9MOLU|nr:hypothetical protein ['Fragaria x ananassa' phyllody phytoplasma]MBS2126158.1 hypothetical protein ['Fragaria x ananassa' phyllody phytoplasma]